MATTEEFINTTFDYENDKFSESVHNFNLAMALRIFNSDSTLRLFVKVVDYVKVGLYLMCFLVNLLTITSVLKYDNLHARSSNILILSLSVADGLLGVNCVTKVLTLFYTDTTTFSQVVCIVHIWFNYISISGNVINIWLIAIERTLNVFYPLRSLRWTTRGRIIKVVLIFWMCLICSTTLGVVFTGRYLPAGHCAWVGFFSDNFMLAAVGQFGFYSITTFCLYAAMFIRIKRQEVKRRDELRGTTPMANTNRRTKMMAVIMWTYYGSFGPNVLLFFTSSYLPIFSVYAYLIFSLTFYLNALLNPIIYAWMNKDFNIAFRKILKLRELGNNYSV